MYCIHHESALSPSRPRLEWVKPCATVPLTAEQNDRRRPLDKLAHRLNMELDLQSLFGLLVHSCTHWLRPATILPAPAFGLIDEGAIGQPR
jgi:hypothetical protein